MIRLNLIIPICTLFLVSCEINQKDKKPEVEFVKIYNHPDEDISYYPQGLIQSDDGGYVFLSGLKMDSSLVEYPRAVLTKVSPTGEIEWTSETEWLAPAPGLIAYGGNYAFAAMDAQNNGYLISINNATGEETGSTPIDVTMPLVLFQDIQGKLAVLGYNYVERTSILAVYSSSATLINKTELNVNTDLITLVQGHMNKSGQEQPFFIGEWQNVSSSGYYFNCLANYTLRTVFVDAQGNPTGGDIYSFQSRDAISSLVNKTENIYALTRYYGGYNYFAANIEVNPSQSQNFNDFVQNRQNELVPEAKVRSLKATFKEQPFLLFASSSNSNSIVVYQYNMEDEEPVNTEYVDFNDKIEICDIIQDKNDNGIVLLGKLYFTGKYLRPVVVKIPAKEFKTE